MNIDIILTWIAFSALMITCILLWAFFAYVIALPTIKFNRNKKLQKKLINEQLNEQNKQIQILKEMLKENNENGIQN